MLSDDVRQRVVSYIQHQAKKPHPVLIDLVAESQARYVDLIASVPDETAAHVPAAGEWSLRELTLHVIAAEEAVTHLIRHTSRGEEPPPREGAGLGMMHPDDGAPFADLVARQRAANEAMLAALRDLPATPSLDLTPPHPWFGPLNCLEWAAFQRVHDEDHIQHAKKILAAVG